MRVDQLVPAYHRGDAIGDEAANLREFLRLQGFTSEIYRLTCDRELEEESKPFSSFPKPRPSDVAVLHFALPSPLTAAFRRISCKRVIIYHNVTAPEFFKEFSQEMVSLARAGREELHSLAKDVDLALADSPFNAQELRELGFKDARVFPLFIDFTRYEKPMNRFVYDLYRDEKTNVLFVGRVVPNKKIEDLIKVTFYYKKYISPLVRLIIVGKTSSLPKYYESLSLLADSFFLESEEIHFLGHIPDAEMFALYRAADVFLSLSEHEGFCLPLIESMIFDLPIIAYNSTAVPSTLGGGGILINQKRVDLVAELLDIVAHETNLRERIIRGQRQRLEEFQSEERGPFFLQALGGLMPEK